jgi:alcohol dehydrogenase
LEDYGLPITTEIHVLTGEGSIDRLGALAKELGFSRTLLVADAGLARAGHLGHAHASLSAAGVDAIEFSEFGPNPDADMLDAGRRYATGKGIDSIIGLGGGSSLDCAKGINFLLTQGGDIHDFQGYGKAMNPMLPMIGVPTTAGTGSEAQSYAIISDPRTHRKMACGDPKAAFRAVILDPRLTLTQPASVTAAAGYDAIAHAVESFVCTTRSTRSQERSLEAWRLLEANYERVLTAPDDLKARAAMQLGAFHAGTAIELSMLGATHACANPVTARYGTTHGNAIAILLPHVVRWNRSVAESLYAELWRASSHATRATDATHALATRLADLASVGGLPRTLADAGASASDLATLATEAAEQWTGKFNPRPFDAKGALEIYECAF